MSIFKAFFGLGKIPKVIKFFEFESFDDVNKTAGAIAAIKDQVREGGLQLTNSQKKFLDDQQKQIEMVFEKINKPIDEMTGIKNTESAKIFNIKGEELDPSKPIIGGTQQGKTINREFFERDAAAKEVQQRIDSGVAATVEKMLAMEPIDAMKEANLVIGRKGPYKNLTQEDAKKILQDTEDHIFERNIKPKETDMDFDDNDFAEGGRIGFKKGMDRRTFMKYMAGLASIPVVGKLFKGAKVASKVAPVAEKAVGASSGQPPAYFFNLVKKIKNLGDDVSKREAMNEREVVTRYKDYELTENLTTGEKTIQRIKIDDTNPTYYDEVLAEETYMNYKPGKGQADETTGGKVADEYTEDTSYIRTSGPQKGDIYDTVEGVADDVIEEGTVFEDNITDFATKETTKTKKADGGRIGLFAGSLKGGGILRTIIKNLAKEKGVSPSEYLRVANYKALPDSAKRFMSEAEFLKLKETMTGKRIEMVENVRDMIQSRLAFDKSKADLAASMNKASPGYGDQAVKMMFPEGSFKSPVPAGAGEKDVMMMEQLIKNLQTKGRKENASGGIARMLGE
jgi:hypothetical protein